MDRCSTRPTDRALIVILLAAVVAVGPLLLAARPAQAATTFTVTTTGDNPNLTPEDGVCDTSAGVGAPCSLRAAIQQANASRDAATIRFNIPGGGLKTIRPTSTLPVITAPVTIDGYTQPGSSVNTAAVGTNAVLRIELDGSATGDFAYGLRIEGANSVVRGLVINRFPGEAIRIGGGNSGVRIAGCFLGTDAAGTAALGGNFGINIDSGTAIRIGGPNAAARNLIAGNVIDGVYVGFLATDTRLQGNLIGTTRTGAGDLGNGSNGVESFDPTATIGGSTAAEANVIAFNGNDGVAVFNEAIGNRILRNSVFANDDLGIDLGDDGVTPNDGGDLDEGPNTRQNFPVITVATTTSVSGTLHSTPNQAFALRLFSNPGAQNEGKFFEEGPITVTTDTNGDAIFTFTPEPPIPAGRSVTATATNQEGGTSEFSAAVPVTAG